jgi:hypothetical protein
MTDLPSMALQSTPAHLDRPRAFCYLEPASARARIIPLQECDGEAAATA